MGGEAHDVNKQANNIYSAKIKDRIKGELCSGASTGQDDSYCNKHVFRRLIQ